MTPVGHAACLASSPVKYGTPPIRYSALSVRPIGSSNWESFSMISTFFPKNSFSCTQSIALTSYFRISKSFMIAHKLKAASMRPLTSFARQHLIRLGPPLPGNRKSSTIYAQARNTLALSLSFKRAKFIFPVFNRLPTLCANWWGCTLRQSPSVWSYATFLRSFARKQDSSPLFPIVCELFARAPGVHLTARFLLPLSPHAAAPVYNQEENLTEALS